MMIVKRLLQDRGAVIALVIITIYFLLGFLAPVITFMSRIISTQHINLQV